MTISAALESSHSWGPYTPGSLSSSHNSGRHGRRSFRRIWVDKLGCVLLTDEQVSHAYAEMILYDMMSSYS